MHNNLYNLYAVIRLKRGKLVLCSYDTITKCAYQLDQEGNQTLLEYYNFTIDHYPDSEEIQNYIEKSKI